MDWPQRANVTNYHRDCINCNKNFFSFFFGIHGQSLGRINFLLKLEVKNDYLDRYRMNEEYESQNCITRFSFEVWYNKSINWISFQSSLTVSRLLISRVNVRFFSFFLSFLFRCVWIEIHNVGLNWKREGFVIEGQKIYS